VSTHGQDGLKHDFGAVECEDIDDYEPIELRIDGVAYHRVDTSDVPAAAADVNVKLDDNGTEFDCVMVAGVIGTSVADAAATDGGADVQHGQVGPASAWWMFTV
jgi:hypothetical protein